MVLCRKIQSGMIFAKSAILGVLCNNVSAKIYRTTKMTKNAPPPPQRQNWCYFEFYGIELHVMKTFANL